jgi:hypothetical protein
MSAEALRDHIGLSVPDLHGRIQLIADFQELIRRDQLPQSPVAAFVMPVGLNPRSEGDAATASFLQPIDDVQAVVLVMRASGDAGGGKSVAGLDGLIWKVIDAVCGSDDQTAIGVYRLTRGRLISLNQGTAFYQLDFAIQRQIRILP